ncbi:MAG: CoB--CoM heterodisulfide reductase iron-sulfur subunit B family protein [Armatimonadetes bacterium]|nr:CoB--CoM heterodisulfide reductase iron-sulfur subunit B family protein [Armatimonadota bacterium]
MNAERRPLALYPGCSLLSTGVMYRLSVHETLRALGIPVRELADWNCCGATSAHYLDAGLALLLPARNLALAEAQGVDILTACAACHHHLARAHHALAHSESLGRSVEEHGIDYRGDVRVQHVLTLLDDAGLAARVRRPLTGLRVACYYGCLLVRIPRAGGIDDPDAPSVMERVLRACGADVVAWQAGTWCCGAGLAVAEPDVAQGLMADILAEAHRVGADCIAAVCPLCQLNLDLHQAAIALHRGFRRMLPVVFVTQLTALALGADPRRLGFDRHLVDALPVLAAVEVVAGGRR